jgi:hypothetical protein
MTSDGQPPAARIIPAVRPLAMVVRPDRTGPLALGAEYECILRPVAGGRMFGLSEAGGGR